MEKEKLIHLDIGCGNSPVTGKKINHELGASDIQGWSPYFDAGLDKSPQVALRAKVK